MPSPCGIHIFKKARKECPICLRVNTALADEGTQRLWTEKERNDRREGGKLGKSYGSPFRRPTRGTDG